MINDCYHSRIGCREYWEENCEELGGELRRTVRDFLGVMTNRRRENESRSRERRQSSSVGATEEKVPEQGEEEVEEH